MSSEINQLEDVDLPLVLVVHNRYQRRGGEDIVVQAEIDLLRSMGAQVKTMIYDSQDDDKLRYVMRRPDQLVFNRAIYNDARALLRHHRIQIVHCHNLFPLLSTSIYAAARAEGVPIVQTVHNYRMGCLNGLHRRDGVVCERCRPGHHLVGVAAGCYRGSYVQSMAFGMVQAINHWRGAWKLPRIYITPTQFLGEKLMSWGIPEEKIIVKPHFVPNDPGPRTTEGTCALFVGRLAEEKGLDLLLDVWHQDRLPLVIVGDGPLRSHLERRVKEAQLSNVSFAGFQDRNGVNALLRQARFLIMPSTWFETFGLVLIEAFAHSVPVIATRIGAIADVVREGETGLLFEINNRADLSAKVSELEVNPARLAAMGEAARHEYEAMYSARAVAQQLRAVYTRAIGCSGERMKGGKERERGDWLRTEDGR
jgi:glycosyltransferase involved in cell wall biosynthesis